MKKILFGSCFLFAALLSIAQQPEGLFRKGMFPGFMRFSGEKAPAFVKGKVQLLTEGNQVISAPGRVLRQEKDKLGEEHVRTQQLLNGIPVEDAVFIQHVRNGKVITANGEWMKPTTLRLPAKAALNKERALRNALQTVGATVYQWQQPEAETMLKKETGNPKASFYPKAELVYFAGKNGPDATRLRLAYKFDIYAAKPLSRQYVYVDAITGKVLGTRNRLHTAGSQATAVTVYSGPQTIVTELGSDNLYHLRDATRGNGIVTLDLRKTRNFSGAVDFSNPTTFWNNINSNKDEYATDAHWGAEIAYDYYLETYGRNSLDDKGMALFSYVHYNKDEDNAYWDGERMLYGDGDVSNEPLTAPDVCGHEFTHGLTEKTSNLNYVGESGALNEGFSDIFGTAVERFGRPGRWDWLIGGDFSPIRDMSHPNAYYQPDTYKGKYWDTFGEVHKNSGVLNYWFYLLTAGGSGTNDNGCAYAVTGIGFDKAAAIAFRTNTVYLVSTSDYASTAKLSIKAAEDLFGANSPEARQTGAAWAAVGLPVAPTVPTVIASRPDICAGMPVTLYITAGSLNGATAWKWYTGNCGETFVGTGISLNVSPTSTTTYYVRGEGGACLDPGECASVNVHVAGTPPGKPVVGASGPTTFCQGGSVLLSAPEGYEKYKWSNGAVTRSINVTTSGSFSVVVYGASSCGSPSSDAVNVTVNSLPPVPVVTPSGGTVLCPGSSVQLTSPAADQYLWSTGAGTPSITVGQTGSYSVTVFNANHCASTSQPLQVTVQDTSPPARPVLPDVTGECSATATAPTTTDDCAGIVAGSTADPVTYNKQGTYTITWHFDDGNGHVTTATQNVVVKDVTKPAITAPGDVLVNTDPGTCSTANISLGVPVATDNCAVASVTNDAPQGGVFPKGTTVVTWTVKDVAGNVATATQKVAVSDKEKPVITPPLAISRNNDPGTCGATLTIVAPAASDNCGSVDMKGSRSDGLPLSAIYPVGKTTLTWTATDGASNIATASQTVIVSDTEKPTITAPSDLTSVKPDPGKCSATRVVLGTPAMKDNCGIDAASLTNDAPAAFPIGTTYVNWKVKDINGNGSSVATQKVVVKDTEIPVVTNVSATPTILWPPNHKMVNVTVNYLATDNCTPLKTALTVSSNEAGSGTDKDDVPGDWTVVNNHQVQLRAERAGSGEGRIYTITITATDAGGNTGTQTVKVMVPHDKGTQPTTVHLNPNSNLSEKATSGLQVQVAPNPAVHQFALVLRSDNDKPLSISVWDAFGRTMENKSNVAAKGSVYIGKNYRAGVYYAEVRQGTKRVVVTLLKLVE